MRLTLLFFFLFNASFALADELKIGYIDVDTVINNISKYENDNKKLISNFEPKKLELIDLFNHIEIIYSYNVLINSYIIIIYQVKNL